jgi:hypothetical protein
MRITLCGSTRFEADFKNWNHRLAIAGHTVYSLSLFARQESDIGKEGNITITDEQKITLDLVHLDKILNSDAVVVINKNGYIGFSTTREIEWARMQSKEVYWIEEGRQLPGDMLAASICP